MHLKSIIVGAAILALAVPSVALAHVTNEHTRYSDIAGSEAKLDIMLASSLDILPGTPTFEPDAPLTKQDLAAWVATSEDLVKSEGHGAPDIAKLAKAALDAGKMSSIDGPATLADVSEAFFDGKVTAPADGAAPRKEEAVQFIVANISTPVNGKSLLESKGMTVGPTGAVSDIKIETNATGGEVFVMTIGGTAATAYAHIKVANGQTDLATWAGRNVRRSLLVDVDGKTFWAYLEADAPDPNAPAAEAAHHHDHDGG